MRNDGQDPPRPGDARDESLFRAAAHAHGRQAARCGHIRQSQCNLIWSDDFNVRMRKCPAHLLSPSWWSFALWTELWQFSANLVLFLEFQARARIGCCGTIGMKPRSSASGRVALPYADGILPGQIGVTAPEGPAPFAA